MVHGLPRSRKVPNWHIHVGYSNVQVARCVEYLGLVLDGLSPDLQGSERGISIYYYEYIPLGTNKGVDRLYVAFARFRRPSIAIALIHNDKMRISTFGLY